MLSLMKINQAERFLKPPPPQPQPMDPAAEMVAFLTNKPVAVTPEEDHMSHIQIHVAYLQNPMLGMNPVMVPITAKVLGHLREHLGHFFATRLQQAVQQKMQEDQQKGQAIQQQLMADVEEIQQRGQLAISQGANPAEIMSQQEQMIAGMGQELMKEVPQPQPPEQVMAQAAAEIAQQDAEFAQSVMQAINDADQFVRDNMEQQDPNMRAVVESSKNMQRELDRKIEKDKVDADLAAKREDNLRELEAIQRLEEKRQADFDQKMKQLEFTHTQSIDRLMQKVELMKNDQDNRQNQITELLKNHDDNKTAVIVEQIRAMMSQTSPQVLQPDVEYVAGVKPLISGTQELNSAAETAFTGSSS
jgi:hypothetical protein